MTAGNPPPPKRESDGTGSTGPRKRILDAAVTLFAESGYDATPTSRIAEHAGVPKGLIHYYFRRKEDILVALVDRLPEQNVPCEEVVVRDDLAESLRRLVGELDRRLHSSLVLSHLLWREADTHEVVRGALHRRFQSIVEQIRRVIEAVLPRVRGEDVDTAAVLLARAINHSHSTARLPGTTSGLDGEIGLIARALDPGSNGRTRPRGA
ncbi:TetR/AcrR family transcriptional regulator [Actinopolyspora erythraea]|uniref:TetR/AcrR family transcriptional regulator n=1 Tax=Actinopolyspora erythraea TaxID=414996 RepID=A0A223RPN4_9ACTN|nr:TetR/AcrR family transcriptional regulator [Actinopolyspora erythraea]ASU77829.1 TetR/AcrR family transcriptional regulator [Actinopolyspora erythraea]